jgi:hypothetical protein
MPDSASWVSSHASAVAARAWKTCARSGAVTSATNTRSRGVAVVLGADLDEQPDPTTGPADVVEQRLDRLLVVLFGQRA